MPEKHQCRDRYALRRRLGQRATGSVGALREVAREHHQAGALGVHPLQQGSHMTTDSSVPKCVSDTCSTTLMGASSVASAGEAVLSRVGTRSCMDSARPGTPEGVEPGDLAVHRDLDLDAGLRPDGQAFAREMHDVISVAQLSQRASEQ